MASSCEDGREALLRVREVNVDAELTAVVLVVIGVTFLLPLPGFEYFEFGYIVCSSYRLYETFREVY